MNHPRTPPLPVLAALLVGLAWLVPTGAEPARRPTAVPVSQSAYACPTGSVISVASGQLRAGTSSTVQVLPGGKLSSALKDATAWRTAVLDGAGVLVRQQGRGSGAVGFFAGTAPATGGGGLVVGACPGLIDDAWLLGLGSGDKHVSTLILTNLADSPAAVDLTLWGPRGKIDAVDSEGIVVDPFAVRRIKLDELAAGEPQLAVQVHRRRGSLSAVANDASTGSFRGTEPLSGSLTPRRSQIVGGISKGTAGRTLLMLNPGNSAARVDVEVIGRANTFDPAEFDDLKIAANSVREIAIPPATGSGRQALRLTSDRPVAAAVRMAPNDNDYGLAESAGPLQGPAVVPIDLGKDVGSPELVLTAPSRSAGAELEAYDSAMTKVASTTVMLKAGTTDFVDLADALDAKDVAYVLVRPRGTIIATANYVKGSGFSSLALRAAPVTVLSPQVRPRS